MQFTEEDVRAALFAHMIRPQAIEEQTTPEKLIRSYIDSGADAEDRREFARQLAQFRRGAEILDAGYRIAMSDRSVVGGQLSERVAARAVGPLIQTSSGHIATSEAWRQVALVPVK